LNAALNSLSAAFLLLGFFFISSKNIKAHKACMLSAFTSSSLFLISYLVYHYEVGSVPFKGQGWMRTVYFTILLTHTILAAAVVPLALITLTRALKERFAAHRRIARWTFPIWLYVSVTGVVVYWMLYGL
jgi:putative membrane protein